VPIVITDEKLVDMYRRMLLIRRFEERVSELFFEGRIPGFIHLCEGQEATEVGVCSALRQDDFIALTHRGHGHCIAKGADTKKLMAEIYCRETGYCGGRGGHMHVASPELGILGGYGIVGGGIPVATGAALALMMQGTDQTSVCFLGDGAVNQGAFHESLNLASCWKLPVIYVCENNQWAICTRFQDACTVQNAADRASAYGMPGVTVDGNDVMAVYDATREAVERAREGKGPTLVESNTYRIRSHSEGFDQVVKDRPYREEAEVQQWKENDPIKRFREVLLERKLLTPKSVKRIADEVENELAQAIEFAEASPWPVPGEEINKVFA
jgi:pyruvate dehydrogenase E1 component alpha subunit